jgi:hypothetical protein
VCRENFSQSAAFSAFGSLSSTSAKRYPLSTNYRPKKTEAALLRERAAVFAVTAEGAPITQANQLVLVKAAESALQAAVRAESPILDIGENATQSEVRDARRRRSVRRGRDVFLPSWRDLCTGLPNALLRSALWSATSVGVTVPTSEVATVNVDLPAHGDARLIAFGPRLGSYDRRVFAVCLDLYRERPLSSEHTDGAVEVSYYAFLRMMNVTYNADSHSSVRASLKRLSALSLHIRSRGFELQLPRLVEVSFADRVASEDRLLGSDRIYVRVMESIATMFGPGSWTSIPQAALKAGKGLQSWLASYYQTHSGPYAVKLTKLYALTGSTCEMPKFKHQLKAALNALSDRLVPEEIRVSNVEWGIQEVTVHLTRWSCQKR